VSNPEGAGNGPRPSASAKEISKWSMVVGALWIGLLTLVKGAWTMWAERPFGLEMTDIIYSGLALAAIFSPVYLSIVIDKMKGHK